MAKKRTTLPKDFSEMLKAGDIEALKAVYDKCELTAHDGNYSKNTALHMRGVPGELVRWLVEQGLDIDIENYYGKTPLYEQAYNSDIVALLLDLGADIQKPCKYGNTPLHAAADRHRPDTVGLFVERGANMNAKGEGGRTPLEYALASCQNIDIPQMAKVAELLLAAGAEITSDMLKSVQRIGEDFEFRRAGFNKDYLAETDAGLTRLYELFGVTPVARRRMHDGVLPITVMSTDWVKQYEELWEMLIPSSGPAKTVQGEVVRIAGRVRDELYRNGGANWDADYRKMLNALPKHLASGTALSAAELDETKALASSIHARGDDETEVLDRLCELATKWVLANPNPVALGKTEYGR